MTNANMKLVTVDVPFPDKLETYEQKLDAGEFIVKRVVELDKLVDILTGAPLRSNGAFTNRNCYFRVLRAGKHHSFTEGSSS